MSGSVDRDDPCSLGWSAILAARHFLAQPQAATTPRAFFFDENGTWRFATDPPPANRAVGELLVVPLADPEPTIGDESGAARNGTPRSAFLFERFAQREPPFVALDPQVPVPRPLLSFRLYLPLLLGAWHARRAGRPFVTAHLAQTLDGRIACRNGQSQWIGNAANLHHAHRLRALHDLVLVGRRTVEADDPRLTVRHVEGPDPERAVVSGSGAVLAGANRYRVFAGAGATVVCSAAAARRLGAHHGNARVLALEVAGDSPLDAAAICAALAQRGRTSIFVEGGGLTVSSFLAAGVIDVLHVHLAPLILGSGIGAFELPEAHTIREGRPVHVESFAIGGDLLLECRTRPPPAP